MSKGRIVFVSRNEAMLVVQHEDGFTVVEMLGDEGVLQVGDEVVGDWTAVASEPIRRDGEVFDAYFQGCWGNPNAAVRVARNTGGG